MAIGKRIGIGLAALGISLGGCAAVDGALGSIASARTASMDRQLDPAMMLSVMSQEHNAARRAVGVPDMLVDAELTREAQAYADRLAASGRFEHSPQDERPDQGENLWRGTAGAYSFESMVRPWVDERRMYRHNVFPDVSTTGRWQDVGHYTQIVWRDTTRFGCGFASGRGFDVLVCRYSPQGNVRGQYAY